MCRTQVRLRRQLSRRLQRGQRMRRRRALLRVRALSRRPCGQPTRASSTHSSACCATWWRSRHSGCASAATWRFSCLRTARLTRVRAVYHTWRTCSRSRPTASSRWAPSGPVGSSFTAKCCNRYAASCYSIGCFQTLIQTLLYVL